MGEWSSSPLGDVCTVIAGQSPKAIFYNEDGKGLPFYQGKKEFTDRLIAQPKKWTTFVTKEAEAGDILMSVRAPVGPINQATEKICIGRGLAAIRPHEEVSRDYLWYALSWLQPTIRGNAGAVFESINKEGIELLRIPLPPLEEQRRIVAVLDEAFEGLDHARAHAEANLRDCQELFDGAISASFANFPEHATHSTLGQIATFRNGLNFTRTSQGDEVRVVGVGDFKDNFEVPISELCYARIDGSLGESDCLNSGDILTVRSNGNPMLIGRTMLVPELDEPTSFSGFTIRIRLKSDRISPEYLCSYMRTSEARAMLTAGGGGANISNINQRLLSSFPVVFPDIDVQLEILDRLERIQSTKKEIVQRYEDTISNAHNLRQSLLQRVFAGELT